VALGTARGSPGPPGDSPEEEDARDEEAGGKSLPVKMEEQSRRACARGKPPAMGWCAVLRKSDGEELLVSNEDFPENGKGTLSWNDVVQDSMTHFIGDKDGEKGREASTLARAKAEDLRKKEMSTPKAMTRYLAHIPPWEHREEHRHGMDRKTGSTFLSPMTMLLEPTGFSEPPGLPLTGPASLRARSGISSKASSGEKPAPAKKRENEGSTSTKPRAANAKGAKRKLDKDRRGAWRERIAQTGQGWSQGLVEPGAGTTSSEFISKHSMITTYGSATGPTLSLGSTSSSVFLKATRPAALAYAGAVLVNGPFQHPPYR